MHYTADRKSKINPHSESITVLGVYSNVVRKWVFLEASKIPAVVWNAKPCVLVLWKCTDFSEYQVASIYPHFGGSRIFRNMSALKSVYTAWCKTSLHSVSNLATSQLLGLVQVSILRQSSRQVAEVLNYWFQNRILDIYKTEKKNVLGRYVMIGKIGTVLWQIVLTVLNVT